MRKIYRGFCSLDPFLMSFEYSLLFPADFRESEGFLSENEPVLLGVNDAAS